MDRVTDETKNLPSLRTPSPALPERLRWLAESSTDKRYPKPLSKELVLRGRSEELVLSELENLYETTSPASPAEMRTLLTKLEVLPRQRMAADGDALRYVVYFEVLADVPCDVLCKAVDRCLRDPEIEFYPTPGKLRSYCKDEIAEAVRLKRGIELMYQTVKCPALPAPEESHVPVEAVSKLARGLEQKALRENEPPPAPSGPFNPTLLLETAKRRLERLGLSSD